jgi:hypothetical protein
MFSGQSAASAASAASVEAPVAATAPASAPQADEPSVSSSEHIPAPSIPGEPLPASESKDDDLSDVPLAAQDSAAPAPAPASVISNELNAQSGFFAAIVAAFEAGRAGIAMPTIPAPAQAEPAQPRNLGAFASLVISARRSGVRSPSATSSLPESGSSATPPPYTSISDAFTRGRLDGSTPKAATSPSEADSVHGFVQRLQDQRAAGSSVSI